MLGTKILWLLSRFIYLFSHIVPTLPNRHYCRGVILYKRVKENVIVINAHNLSRRLFYSLDVFIKNEFAKLFYSYIHHTFWEIYEKWRRKAPKDALYYQFQYSCKMHD